MPKVLFNFFLILHILGDFYFQSNALSEKKQNEYKYVAFHGFIYLMSSLACVILYWSVPLMITVIVLAVSHFIIDSAKFIYINKKGHNTRIYILDQLIHIIIVAVAASFLGGTGFELKPIQPLGDLLSVIVKDPDMLIIWGSALLMSIKPANVTIKQLIIKFKPAKKQRQEHSADNFIKAGEFIGALERIIILLFLSVNQYTTIGFVLTAKSIARYNKISTSKKFAEYYLLGTLLSALFAIVIYFLLIS